jgi:hypothetical protein
MQQSGIRSTVETSDGSGAGRAKGLAEQIVSRYSQHGTATEEMTAAQEKFNNTIDMAQAQKDYGNAYKAGGLQSPQTPDPIAQYPLGRSFDLAEPRMLQRAGAPSLAGGLSDSQLLAHEARCALNLDTNISVNGQQKRTLASGTAPTTNVPDNRKHHKVYDLGGRLYYPIYVPNVLRWGRRDKDEAEERIATSVAHFDDKTGMRIPPRITATDETR